MKTNRNYAKTEDGIFLEFAPREFAYNGIFYNATNSEEIYNDLGYFKLERTEMPYKEGFYYTAYYEVIDNKLVEKWEEHEEPPVMEVVTEEQIRIAIEEGVNSIDS